MTDDVAGKALVEQFALDTFARADNAVRANKASRQTADTFQAAATFMELLAIWGPIDPEIHRKIKFAKFHAVRIAKALKAGEDPNLSNPNPEPAPEQLAPPLDPDDPEVRALSEAPRSHRQPSVTEIPDEADKLQARLAQQSNTDESIHPSRAPSVPPPNEIAPPQDSGTVSPLPRDAANFYSHYQGSGSPVSPDRQSLGGNYFPRMPSPTSAQTQHNLPPMLPSAPSALEDASPLPDLPSAPANPAGTQPGPSLPEPPTTFSAPVLMAPKTPLDSFQPPPVAGQPTISSIPSNLPQAPPPIQHIPQQPQAPTQNPAPAPYSPPMVPPNLPTQPQAPQSVPIPMMQPRQPAVIPVPQPVPTAEVIVDEEAIMKAQKHARWAISALNFEDVPTAVKEFQLALQLLGAR